MGASASYKRLVHQSKLSSTSQIDKAISTRYKANFIVLFLAVLTQLLSTYLFLQLHLTEVKLLTCPTYIPPEYHLLGLPRDFVYYLPLRFVILLSDGQISFLGAFLFSYWMVSQTDIEVNFVEVTIT